MQLKLVLLVLASLITSCVNLSQQGANVLLVETKELLPAECHFIRYVEAYGPQDELASAFAAAKINLRNRAGKYQANYVVITKKMEVFLPGGAIVGGNAYECAEAI